MSGTLPHADEVMMYTAHNLLSDFRNNGVPLEQFMPTTQYLSAFLGYTGNVRELVPYTMKEIDPYAYKCVTQVTSFLKRHRLQSDTPESVLEDEAAYKFVSTQERLRALDYDKNPGVTGVLSVAASFLKKWLGPFNAAEHRNACRFASRATVGIPRRRASEEARWELPISSSTDMSKWFDEYVASDPNVHTFWMDMYGYDLYHDRYTLTEVLPATFVPKSYKSVRVIMPNTTIGSFYSGGLEVLLTRRLRKLGYNLQTLQDEHKQLAKLGSMMDHVVTADLSSASDSITDKLISHLFPQDWYDALRFGRIRKVSFPNLDCDVLCETFSTMGIGFTFPLQTLVFLSLLHAVASLKCAWLDPKRDFWISVYGDDLIYHRSLHEPVALLFKEVGLILNQDKTFPDGPFRESCGGDYYRGVGVRPCSPELVSWHDDISCRVALYKVINGLLSRWHFTEISATLTYLLTLHIKLFGPIPIVPRNYGDDAGVKSSYPVLPEFLRGCAIRAPRNLGHGMYRFSALFMKFKERRVIHDEPYYWRWLRTGGRATVVPEYIGPSNLRSFVNYRLPNALLSRLDKELTVSSVVHAKLKYRVVKSGEPDFVGPPIAERIYVSKIPTETYKSCKLVASFD